ncbi:hypothetical protein DFQ28_003578, partial [Apophysomyces sp. BC1034]
IDLLIRYDKDVKFLELSSNEFKKPSAMTFQAIAQQNKNFGDNCALLNHLRGLNTKIGALVVVDWIGNIGYLYCLVDHQGVYVAKSIDILNILISVSCMAQFKNTLQLLFDYKHFILRTGILVEHSLNERQHVDRLREAIEIAQ